MVFQGGVDLEEVVEEEGVVGGHASKPWPPALMLSWWAMCSHSVICYIQCFLCLDVYFSPFFC